MTEEWKPRTELKPALYCVETQCRYNSQEMANGCCKYGALKLCQGIEKTPKPGDLAEEVRRRKMGWRAWERERREKLGPWALATVRLEELSKTLEKAAREMDSLSCEIAEAKRAERAQA